MNCPQCNAWTTVLETRTRQDNTRRRTLECGNQHKFRTVERIEVVTKGGDRRTKENKS